MITLVVWEVVSEHMLALLYRPAVDELFQDPAFRQAYFAGELDEAIKSCASRGILLDEWLRYPGAMV